MCGLYRIDPSSVEETIKIHKTLILMEYIKINRVTTDQLYKIVDQFTNTLECFNPAEFQKLRENCYKLSEKLTECINEFLDTEMQDKCDVHKYATILLTLTGMLKAYETILGLKLEQGLHEMLMELGAVNVKDLQMEKGDEDAKT